MRALIGHTGFVGSNLLAQGRYDLTFNSKNSQDMRNGCFTEIVCAGVSAVKWKANQDPDADWAGIEDLIANLECIKADRFVLLSSVDVYQHPFDVNEDTEPDVYGSPYGVHRAKLEKWVRDRFEESFIIRLPALYGPGLKKNAIYDLVHDNQVDKIDPRSKFQWYDVSRLEADIGVITERNLRLFNITSEPISMHDIGKHFFPGRLHYDKIGAPVTYNYKTKYADVLGGTGDYHFSSADVIDGMERFLGSFS